MVECAEDGCNEEITGRGAYCEKHKSKIPTIPSVHPSGPPIIITGGSVTVEYDPATLGQDRPGRLRNANAKIRHVQITDDRGVVFDNDTPGGKVTITIYYG